MSTTPICPNCQSPDTFSPYSLDPQTPVFECGECESKWAKGDEGDFSRPEDSASPLDYQREMNDPLGGFH